VFFHRCFTCCGVVFQKVKQSGCRLDPCRRRGHIIIIFIRLVSVIIFPLLSFIPFIVTSFSREKRKDNVMGAEIRGPPSKQRPWDKVGLVENKDVALERVDLAHVLLKVVAAVKQGVTGVNDLSDCMAALNHAPKLAPDVEVLFERSEGDVTALGLFDLGKRAAPLKEGITFHALKLLSRDTGGPGWPSRHAEGGVGASLSLEAELA
jgi:hypothetical protein